MLDLVGRTAAMRLRNRRYDTMMQEVLETTAVGCFQVENDSPFVVGGKTCWMQTTLGRYFYTGLIGSMRMCRG